MKAVDVGALWFAQMEVMVKTYFCLQKCWPFGRSSLFVLLIEKPSQTVSVTSLGRLGVRGAGITISRTLAYSDVVPGGAQAPLSWAVFGLCTVCLPLGFP